ncbi:AAA family ATPase [Mycolicibacterium fortuitum]|uniref:McrB family protein n=1 Tax=Mycolicibacterium conceptionense TaxID=451644 RepID=UPI003204A0D7|nr:AAA family ATPase [Mycolicibacterium fortuitum]
MSYTLFDHRPAATDYLPPAPSARRDSREFRSAIDSDTISGLVNGLVEYVTCSGYIFHPWQIAAYVTAARTKPFIILAGISGTGKTKLPRLIAEATSATFEVIAVRPDWTDSGDVLGYRRLDDTFVAGPLLKAAHRAMGAPDQQHFVLLDEMNLARVEYYLAEVLSALEDRYRDSAGNLVSRPLLPGVGEADGVDWGSVHWPPNLCLVGSVNMDETTHGFSRKVLDRAFVIEFSDIDLNAVPERTHPQVVPWPLQNWRQEFASLGEFPKADDAVVLNVIGTLNAVNEYLTPAQLQVGYRIRDEVALFCANAQANSDTFTSMDGQPVEPLDLAVSMKVLPRIQGGGSAIRSVLDALQTWSAGSSPDGSTDPDAGTAQPAFPVSQKRIDLMQQRLDDNGFTSYWL